MPLINQLAREIIPRIRQRIGRIRRAVWSAWLPRPTSGTGRFIRRDPKIKVTIELALDARVELRGNVYLQSNLGQRGHTRIALAKGASLRVLGDFNIGPDVLIIIGENAELVLGGRQESSGSGITASSRIMVRERVEIGADSIIAWDVFITDCDWHSMDGAEHTKATTIGRHVWVAHGSSVLKGSIIGDDSIVAAHGVCIMREFAKGSLLGGVPARELKQGVSWTRELT